MLISRDRLNGAPRREVALTCARLFDRIQELPPETQILSLAGAFVLMADAYGFSAQEAFTAVKNLMVDPQNSSGIAHQFDAMRWHLETELKEGAGKAHYAHDR